MSTCIGTVNSLMGRYLGKFYLLIGDKYPLIVLEYRFQVVQTSTGNRNLVLVLTMSRNTVYSRIWKVPLFDLSNSEPKSEP